jgi:hypothetical protein
VRDWNQLAPEQKIEVKRVAKNRLTANTIEFQP